MGRSKMNHCLSFDVNKSFSRMLHSSAYATIVVVVSLKGKPLIAAK